MLGLASANLSASSSKFGLASAIWGDVLATSKRVQTEFVCSNTSGLVPTDLVWAKFGLIVT